MVFRFSALQYLLRLRVRKLVEYIRGNVEKTGGGELGFTFLSTLIGRCQPGRFEYAKCTTINTYYLGTPYFINSPEGRSEATWALGMLSKDRERIETR